MLGQRRGIELLERHNGTSVAQPQGFIGAEVARLGEVGGQADEGCGEQGSKGFHGCLRIFYVLPTGATLAKPT
ncbi:hypothetical protein D3C85_1787450 [compost metagenome]